MTISNVNSSGSPLSSDPPDVSMVLDSKLLAVLDAISGFASDVLVVLKEWFDQSIVEPSIPDLT